MAYVESNGHMLDDVTCPVFIFATQCVVHATFRIDYITWKYRKKQQIYNSKNYTGYITKRLVDILTRCSK